MVTQALQLAVAADAHAPAGADDLPRLGSGLGKGVLVLAEPRPPPGLLIDDVVGSEAVELGVVVHLSGLVEEIFRKRAAVVDQQGGRIADARLRVELHHVLVERHDRQAVLVAGEAVDGVGEVKLQVEPALGGGHDLQLLGGLHHQLSLLAVAHDVGLQVLRAVVLLVLGEHAFDFFQRLKGVVGEDARAGGKSAQSQDFPHVYQVLVGESVIQHSLHVQPGGHPVGQVGQEAPVLHVQHALADFSPVRVGVNETGDDKHSADVKAARARWNPHPPAAADADDAIVGHHHIGVADHLVALHGDDGGAAQNDGAVRLVTRKLQRHFDFFHGGFLFPCVLLVVGFFAFRIFFLFLLLGLLKRDGIERLPEKSGAHRPGQGLAVVGPSEVVRTHVGQFLERHAGLADVDGGRLATHLRHRQQVELVLHVRQHPAPVRAHAHVAGPHRLLAEVEAGSGDLDVLAPVGAVQAH